MLSSERPLLVSLAEGNAKYDNYPLELALPTTARTWGCLSSDAYKYSIPFAFSIKNQDNRSIFVKYM
jgi:hypothetical protein